MTMLTKADILRGLRKIDIKAKGAGILIDLSIYGHSELCLVVR